MSQPILHGGLPHHGLDPYGWYGRRNSSPARDDKRRLHKTPAQREFDACQRWLDAELSAIRPQLVICFGASAARVAFQAPMRIGEHRGQALRSRYGQTLITAHPSSVLRAPAADQEDSYRRIVADLVVAHASGPSTVDCSRASCLRGRAR